MRCLPSCAVFVFGLSALELNAHALPAAAQSRVQSIWLTDLTWRQQPGAVLIGKGKRDGKYHRRRRGHHCRSTRMRCASLSVT